MEINFRVERIIARFNGPCMHSINVLFKYYLLQSWRMKIPTNWTPPNQQTQLEQSNLRSFKVMPVFHQLQLHQCTTRPPLLIALWPEYLITMHQHSSCQPTIMPQCHKHLSSSVCPTVQNRFRIKTLPPTITLMSPKDLLTSTQWLARTRRRQQRLTMKPHLQWDHQ